TDAGVLELLLEGVEAAELLVDRIGERAGRLAAAVGAHDLPEERVVEVAAGVVADGGAVRDRVEVLEDLLDVLVGPLAAFEGGVGLVDVSLVVLVVVDAHRRLVDVGLERVVVVRKVGDFICHLRVSLSFVDLSWGLLNLYPRGARPLAKRPGRERIRNRDRGPAARRSWRSAG